MLWRNTLREIKQSFGRFITIFIIIALGVGFFSGLKVSKTAMVETGNRYISKSNFYDYRIMSTLGCTDEDAEAFSELSYTEYAEGAFFTDAFFSTDSQQDLTLAVHSITENINILEVEKGRLPQNGGECVLDSKLFGEDIIGKKIYLSDSNDEETVDNFKYREYTVVGTVSSPFYLNFERGQASIGDGQVDAFMYLPYDGLDVDYYTEIFVTLKQKEYIYSDEYDEMSEKYMDDIERLADERADIRYSTVVSEAEDEISDGERELLDAKRKYNDAVNELNDAWDTLEDARKEIEEGWREYDDGRREAAAKIAEANVQITGAKKQLNDARIELNEGEKEYADGLAEYNDGKEQLDAARRQLAAASASLSEARAQLEAGESSYSQLGTLNSTVSGLAPALGYSDGAELIAEARENETLKGQLDSVLAGYGQTADGLIYAWDAAEAGLSDVLAQYGQTGLTNAFLNMYLPQLRQSLDSGWSEYNSGAASLASARAEYNKAREELAAAEEELKEARKTLDEGWADYYEAQNEILDAEETLAQETADALKELEDAKVSLTDGEREYAEGLQEYLDAKREAEPELNDARVKISDGETELSDARQQLLELEYPTVFALDRYMNAGYACFESDTDIVESISTVFPVFFILVAALVCITTMTRMVEENRGQIGTLKALGYGKGAIMGKFLFYSGSASLAGCIVGFFGGSYLFPKVIWTGYGIMYGFADIVLVFDYVQGLVSTAAYLACSLGATYLSCYGELHETPAQIMRPKAPKNGKRIFLERIKFIWSRMSFLYKVSARNIFRYKKRLVMMLVGIAGSTALLLTAFGINDSIRDVVNYQYDEISLYDYSVTFRHDLTDGEKDGFVSENSENLESVKFLHESSVDVKFGSRSKQTYLLIPDGGDFEGFFNMQSGGEKVPFPGDGEAVINNGLAEVLGISAGDTIVLQDTDLNEIEVRVSGIIDNYVYNYVFITFDTYASQMGYMPEITTAYAIAAEGADIHKTAAEIMNEDSVSAVSASADMRTRINNMMESLNYIILFVAICAGALAFTVIYNLTNINITERIREIATIKVLGFNSVETALYVFRENLIMTAMGGILGLGLGKLLHAFVMEQIKIDLMRFDVRILPFSYIFAFVLTIVFAVVVDAVMFFKLKRVNMAESLKSIE